MKIGWLTGRSWRGEAMAPGELPAPDAEDFNLVAPHATGLGVQLEPAIWDDPDLEAAGYDAVLIRSTWDYAERLDAFLVRLDALAAAGVTLFNPPALVRWNARKTYLRELEAAGVPVIPTHWVDAVTTPAVARAFDAFEAAEIVAKPQVGAGARGAIRLRRNAWGEGDLALGPSGPAMLQPFLAGVEREGEVSLFAFGGRWAHTVRKVPPAGGWFANAKTARFAAAEPTSMERAVAAAALAAAPHPWLQARVDLVPGPDGRPCVIELELIEPYLFLGFAPEAAADLARALAEGRLAAPGAAVLPE